MKSVLIPAQTNTEMYRKMAEAAQFFKSQIAETNLELEQS